MFEGKKDNELKVSEKSSSKSPELKKKDDGKNAVSPREANLK